MRGSGPSAGTDLQKPDDVAGRVLHRCDQLSTAAVADWLLRRSTRVNDRPENSHDYWTPERLAASEPDLEIAGRSISD